MTRHILDRNRRRDMTRVAPYASVARRSSPEGSHPAVLKIMRRAKGPMNTALRTSAFLKIERGFTA